MKKISVWVKVYFFASLFVFGVIFSWLFFSSQPLTSTLAFKSKSIYFYILSKKRANTIDNKKRYASIAKALWSGSKTYYYDAAKPPIISP